MTKAYSTYVLPLFIGILLMMSGCSQSSSSEVNSEFGKYIAAFSSGKVSSSSDIYIELAEDVQSVELNEEISESLFSFSPSVKGRAYWTSTRNIKFSPEPGELKAGQKYDVTFKLGKVLEVSKEFKEFNFSFQVPNQSFNIDLYSFSPMKDNDMTWNSIEGLLLLADVTNEADIVKMFSLKGENSEKASIKVIPTGTTGRYTIQIDSLYRSAEKDLEYMLVADGKVIKSEKKGEYEISIPKLDTTFKLVSMRLLKQPQTHIRLTFNQILSANQNIQGLIKLSGVTNYTYDIQKNVMNIYVDKKNDARSIGVQVYKELKSADKIALDKAYSFSFTTESVKPEITVSNSGNILPNGNQLIIPFKAVSLWAVDVKIIKIFESNVLSYFQVNDFGATDEIKRYGRLVAEKRVRLDQDPTLDLTEWNTFTLDLAKLMDQDTGSIYRIEFKMQPEYSLYSPNGDVVQIPMGASMGRLNGELSEDDLKSWDTPYNDYYGDDYDWSIYNWDDKEDPTMPTYYMGKAQNCLIMSSNIGVTAKLDNNKSMLVVANNILTTEPIADAKVGVYNYQMQRIGSGVTDADGMVDVPYKGGVPFAVIVSNGKEKGYLKVSSNLALSLSNFDVSGKQLPKGLKGYIYGERGVWRPGDDIFLTFILEDKDDVLPKDHPVELELFTPQGQMYNRTVKSKGENGFYAFKLKTEPEAVTGNWQVKIAVGGINFTKRLSIETVKPNRLKVRLNTGDIIDATTGSLSATISSQWLHGAPASNLRASVEMTLSLAGNPFDKYSQYTFNNPANSFTRDSYDLFDGTLDATGSADFTTRLPEAASAPGMLKANVISRVFETGGDASIYAQTIPYSPYSHYAGVRIVNDDNNKWLETDKENPIEVVTLTKDGKPVDRKVNVKIYKMTWSWWWSNAHDDLSSYVNSSSAKTILNETITTSGGKGRVNFKVNYPEWGRYLVMVKDINSGHISGKIAYVDWPYWRGRSEKGDANGLTMLSFSTDKQAYKVGDEATVIIPKSSAGRALLSIEQGSKILSKGWVKTSPTEDTKHVIKITKEMAPNFYISVNLLQPHAQTNNDLPIRLYGVLNISVDNSETVLTPVLNMPESIRPETEFTVTVSEKNAKDMTYTLAIVDEGLLDLTAFKTPNAWNDFYSRQALSVRTWDMYELVIGARTGNMGPLLSVGGDEALEPAKNPINRFKPVVKFLGPFSLKSGGINRHKITLPPYFGSVRAMVVAGNSKGAYGSAEKDMKVKNPLMVLSTLPRVAGPDEEILVPVNVFAMEKSVKEVKVSIESNGLFMFTEGTTKTVTFTEEGDKTVFFKAKTKRTVGNEKIVIKVSSGAESATETIDIEVRNPNPNIILSKYALVGPGESTNLDLQLTAVQSKDWVKMEVSRMPSVNLNQNLDYLLAYPHGCSEQVTSRVLPLLYVKALKDFTADEKAKIDYNIKEGIKILVARQLNDGGFVYWPGNPSPNEWVSSYIGHFLVEAERAGYNVPSSAISKWIRFQKNGAQNWNNRSLYNHYYSHGMSDLQQAYRLYTLALAGSPDLGSMNRLKERKELSVQARWRLAAAYALAGKKDAAVQLTSGAIDKVDEYAFSNNTYGSASRDKAMIMETYLLLGNTEKALALANDVSAMLNNANVTTQSASYGLMAMSKLAKEMGQGLIAYDWTLNGVAQKTTNQGTVFQEVNIKPQSDVNVAFTNKGKGKLFVRLVGRTQPLGDKILAQDGDAKMYVRYLTEDGKELDVSSLRQGTEFYAEVSVQNTTGLLLTDMAVTQIFASGWEIFNTRLFDADSSQGALYNHQDIRDDRVMTYFNLRSGYSTTIRIRLQAAYCGRYYLPGVTCETMYNPSQQTRTAGQWVVVKQ